MAGRLRSGAARRNLGETAEWRLLRSEAGHHAEPPAADAPWKALPSLGTAAEGLRAVGAWSLDLGPEIDFDAHDWWFSCRFDVADVTDAVLGLDGLATLGEVWLNGQRLLRSDNMFVAYQLAVGPILRPLGNELQICARALSPVLAGRRPRPAWRVPMLPQQQLRWQRTTLLGRAPGWTPPAAPVGPWRDVWLESGARLRTSTPDLSCGLLPDGRGHVRLTLDLAAVDGVSGGQLELRRGGRVWQAPLAALEGAAWQAELYLPEPELWWPHTHGEPALYELTLTILHGTAATTLEMGRVGFRTLEVDTRDGGFGLRVNGEPVFCRGACWTPVDAVSLRAPIGALSAAVAQVRDAGMNMLRVGGTMVYEDDAFYDACDAQGVLVWQDLMFANMDYPAGDPAWRESVAREVAQQVARWQGRPSLAVVCGNSEVSQQAAMWGAPKAQWQPPFFTTDLAEQVHRALPDTPYWPSSAWGGAFPHQVDQGTTSYYGVGAYLRPLRDATGSGLRFATECLAFANVPAPATIDRMPGGAALRVTHAAWKARSSRDLTAGWDFEDVRDHYLNLLLNVDPVQLRYEDHARYLQLSRVASGEAMAAAFSQWRAVGSRCSGALVWFLRDLWAGAGWGLQDDQGLPKPCWHALRRVLQARAVVITDEGASGLRAHVINEGPQPLRGRLVVEVWAGDTCRERGMADINIEPQGRLAVDLLSLLERFFDLTRAYRFGPLAHDACVARLESPNGDLLSQAWHFPAGLGWSKDPSLGLLAVAAAGNDGCVQVTASTQRTALAVHVDAPGWVADDEYFHLAPGQCKVVTMRPLSAARPWYGVIDAINASAPVTIRDA